LHPERWRPVRCTQLRERASRDLLLREGKEKGGCEGGRKRKGGEGREGIQGLVAGGG
jgi:hypothetical protein